LHRKFDWTPLFGKNASSGLALPNPRHRPAIESKCAGGDDQVAPCSDPLRERGVAQEFGRLAREGF
jgi:hypothetical protein